MSPHEVKLAVQMTLFTTFVLEPVLCAPVKAWLFAPVKRWWSEVVWRKQLLLETDMVIRWEKNGGNAAPLGWRDHFRAWRYYIIWRCSGRLPEELETRLPLCWRDPPRF
jgi:hypothetical protein